MDLGVDVVVVRTPFEDFTVRVQRAGVRVEGEGLQLARWAASQFRFGVGLGEPGVVRAARELVALLDGQGFGFGRELVPLDDGFGGVSSSNRFDVGAAVVTAFGAIAGRLEEELLAGRLIVERQRVAPLTERRELFELELPPLPPARRETGTRTFEVRFVDEVGKAISGVDAEFSADGAQTRATNAAGIALLDGVQAGSANVAVLDPDALAKVLDPRWENFRPGAPPKESNTQEVVFRGDELGPFSLKAELPNTVVIKPPLGRLLVELFDKTGRVRHANRTFQITGPQTFEGTTDDEGRLLQDGVFPGDYQLSLALEFFEENDPDRQIDIVDSSLVVLESGSGEPQVRMIGAVPRSILARLHLFFNTNKTFLLPTALPSMLKLRRLYADNAPCELLVVGHADTRGGPAFNDKLSLERAEATIAYLKDDVEGWLKFYSDSDAKKKWGKVEDHLMIVSMRDFVTKPKGEEQVRWFQRTRGLKVDGDAGKETRRALIKEYMSLDGASLSEFVGEITATAHGCGENFPLDDSGEELDATPADQKRDPIDRRVELYFFDPEFGITPPPPGPNSKSGGVEYPLWRKRVAETVELQADDLDAPQVTFVELADAHFRTNSAVVLPEGETPDAKGEHEALTSVGLIATALRFNDEHAGRSVLVAGHTDTAADDALNDELSRQRAKVALALLTGERDDFVKLGNARHDEIDVTQIFDWAARSRGFTCKPTRLDAIPSDLRYQQFRASYNAFLDEGALKAETPPRGPKKLSAQGRLDTNIWGAIFDLYEFNLREELGEDAAGVAALRTKLKFTDPDRKSLGFGERFPIEELGVDNFRSQTNRRVEILFFEPGEEPDLIQAESDPETSDLYLPGFFERTPLDPLLSAKPFRAEWSVPASNSSTPRDMVVSAPGLPAGTPVELTLFVNDQPVRLFELTSVADGASQTYDTWEPPDEIEPVSLKPGQPFLPVVYTFVAEVAGRIVATRVPLAFADRANVQLSLDLADGAPDLILKNEAYVLQTPFGTREGKTNDQGVLDEQGLPPGGITLMLRGRHLIHLGKVPYNWDAEP